MLKVSIITTTLNSEKNLDKCIRSVINQTYKNIEYLVIDGCSSDKTLQIIKKYKKKINFILSEKDRGIWDAMNKGLRHASGDIVCFLNSDDFFYKKSIETVVRYFETQDIDFLFGSVKKYKLMYGYRPWKIKFSFGFYTSHSVGFFIKRTKHLKVGFYNKKFLSADLDFFYRMIVNHNLIGISSKKNEVMGKFRKGGFSSKINYIEHLQDLNKIRLSNGQFSIFVYALYFYKLIKNFRRVVLSYFLKQEA